MTVGPSTIQVQRIMESLAVLAGERGNPDYRAVRWADLAAHPEVRRMATAQQVVIGDVAGITEPESGALAVLSQAIATAEGQIDTVQGLANTAQQAADAAQASVDQVADDLNETFGAELELRHTGEINAAESIEAIFAQLQLIQLRLADTNQLIADAGIYIDPAAGSVEIAALHALDGTVADLSIRLDAANSEIALRATEAYVSQAISNAVLDPSQIPIVNDLQVQVNDLELSLGAAEAEILLRATTTTVDEMDVRLGSAELAVDSLEAEMDLRVTQTAFDAVETRVTGVETTYSALEGAGLISTVSDVRSLAADQSASNAATLEQLLHQYETRQLMRAELAYVQQEVTARVTENQEAEAVARQALGVLIDGNTSLIEDEQTVRAAADSVMAQDITVLQGRVTDTEDGLTQAEADILDLNTLELSSTSALVQSFLSLQGTVNDPSTGLAAAHGEITDLNNVDVGSGSALVQAHLGLEATVNDGSTGLAAAHGDIDELNNVDVSSTSALVTSHLALTGRVGATEADISQLNFVDASSTSALVLAHLALEGVITDPTTGLNAAHGAIDDIKALDIDPASVLASTLTSLDASISYADDANPSFYQLLLTTSSFDSAGDSVTMSNAAGALGQTGSVDLTDTQVAPYAWGTTSGASIEIPVINAAHFYGQRVRIDVMARYPGASTPPTMGIAMSALAAGNSGILIPETALTSSHAWHTVYYDVPPNAPAELHIGIFADMASGGETINVSRVAVRRAALAEELPGIGVNSAAIDDILTLNVDAGTALAQHTTQVTSTLFPEGGTPLETRVTTTEQSVDGIRATAGTEINNNGHVSGWALISDLIDGNPSSEFAVVADIFKIVSPTGSEEEAPFIVYTSPTVVNGATVPAGIYLNSATLHEAFITAAHIEAATITAAEIADATITAAKLAGTIASTNYDPGVAGWQITMGGDAEFNSLTVREDNIEDGAVTEEEQDGIALPRTISTISTPTKLAEVTISTDNKVVNVVAQIEIHRQSGSLAPQFNWWLEKDGAQMHEKLFLAVDDLTLRLFTHSTGAIGAGDYSLWVEKVGGGTCIFDTADIVAQVSKK